MRPDINRAKVRTDITLVGQLADSSTYDEAFLSCTDGYCIFNQDQQLQAFSSDFPNLYPTIREHIYIGMTYAEYLRVFFEYTGIQNMGTAVSVEQWLEVSLSVLEHKRAQHVHHLHDGRWMQIDMSRTSSGQWLFLAMDVTALRQSQIELKDSQKRYRSFAHMAMDWFWELDEKLRYVYHSEYPPAFTGKTNTELVGLCRLETVHGEASPSDVLKEHVRALSNHEPFNGVLEWRVDEAQVRHINVIAQPVFDKAGVFTGYLGCGREVTAEINLQSQLNHIAEHDDMTGLLNRRAFESTLTALLEQVEKKDSQATLCFIDLDRFKLVNDGGGHDAGDQLLISLANTFCDFLGDQATVARLGGDEFGVIQKKGINEALFEINELIKHISSTPFEWKQRKYTIGASAGLVSIDSSSKDISELMSHADTACYLAKDAGRNQAQIYKFDEYFQDPVSLELKQVNLLRHAMDNDGLMLYLQPIKPLQFETNHQHFEVLLRLDDNGQVKSAGEFIPVAEKYDLMQHLDKWVMRESLIVLNAMLEDDLDVSFSINLSGNTLSNISSSGVFQNLISEAGISARRLVFEVTETVAIKNLETAQKFINDIKKLGCQFSLDDFGSGLSSFGYLKEMCVDYLKIDGSFVKDMNTDVTCKAIVGAFNQLSHELGMKTVAEFVEDAQTEALLTELGIDFAQGYGVGEPRDAAQWHEFLLQNRLGITKAG